MPHMLLDRNDNVIRLRGAYTIDLATGLPVYLTASATVGVTVYRPTLVAGVLTDVALTVETWPVVMSYIAGNRGDFIGVLRDTLVLTPGETLKGVLTGDNGADQHFERDIEILVVGPKV